MPPEPLNGKSDLTLNRIILIALIVGVCAFCWFAVRTQVGSMLGELTSPSSENALDTAALASRLSPWDPRPPWLAATKLRQNFEPKDLEQSVTFLEDATKLAPNDYRIWTELARGYEQTERYDDAERVLRRSIEIAPSYAIPHWQMGNFLLRQDRLEEAKSELKKTTETSSVYRDQVYALAWDYFGKDPVQVESLASDSADARANLAQFYAQRSSGRDSLRIWNSLSPEQKEYYKFIAKPMARRLYETGFVREALAVARDVGIAKDAENETVNNGGFEKFIGDHTETLFGWMIFRNDSKFDALPDSQVKAEGNRSLRVAFRNYVKADLYNIAQVVTVEPNRKYRLTFKLRTDNLRSGGPPFLEVAAVKTNSRLAASEPFPIGSNDWQEIMLDFTVPEGVEGVEIRTLRINCGEVCPIAGTFWYDDFRLSRL
ncbi:MAG: tetratricopeptide repeat protein [Pyrinomonadaceae bacterium]